MTTIVLIILIGIFVVIKVLAQVGIHLHKEIFLTNCNPIELRLRVEETFHLSIELSLVVIALLSIE